MRSASGTINRIGAQGTNVSDKGLRTPDVSGKDEQDCEDCKVPVPVWHKLCFEGLYLSHIYIKVSRKNVGNFGITISDLIRPDQASQAIRYRGNLIRPDCQKWAFQPNKVQEGQDQLRNDIKSDHWGKALKEGCHERRKAQGVCLQQRR